MQVGGEHFATRVSGGWLLLAFVVTGAGLAATLTLLCLEAAGGGVHLGAHAALAGLALAALASLALAQRTRRSVARLDLAGGGPGQETSRGLEAGRLAGVAQELEAPLSSVVANLIFAAEALPEAPFTPAKLAQVREAIAESREGAVRLQGVVRDLQTFAPAREAHRERLEVNEVLEAAVGMAGARLRRVSRLVRRLEPVAAVEGDPGQLAQALLNLLLNAAQAMPSRAAEENEIAVTTRTGEAGRVVLEVRDNGVGMGPELLRRIFEPFFTTRPRGEGKGLGLAVCRNVVEAMRGTLEVESAPGRGSTFRLSFPPASP